MKEVTPEEVRHMAKLSRLYIDDDETRLFCRQFSEILEHMGVLAAVDTRGVEPCFSPVSGSSSLREDVVEKRRDRREILANAPETDGEFFIVPKII